MNRPQRILYVASSSPRRTEILSKYKISHTVIKNQLDIEVIDQDKYSLKHAIRVLAHQKASLSQSHYNGLILGVDTCVVFQETILGKPESITDAKRMLKLLSGKTHRVISGFCLLDTLYNTATCRTEESLVTFKRLNEEEIHHYCTTFQVLDKAGGYGIQDIKNNFISSIEGSYYNIMGLPINSLLKLLAKYDIVL